MKKKFLICVYAIVQLAVFILLPLGFFLRQPICLYVASPLALIAGGFIVVYLKRTNDKKNER